MSEGNSWMPRSGDQERPRPAVTVILPARDEAATVGKVVRGLREELARLSIGPYEVLVIDDGSRDETAERARQEGAKVLRGSSRGGYGAAVKRGLAQAQGQLVLLLDADGTYPLDGVGALLQGLAEGADQVIAARPSLGASGFRLRQAVKAAIHWLAGLLAGVPVPDLNSGMRALPAGKLRAMAPLLPDGFSLTTSLTMAGLLRGWDVRWVPLSYTPRGRGSKFRPIRDTLRLLAALLRSLVYFAPLRLFVPVSVLTAVVGLGFAFWDVSVEHNLGDKTVLTFLTALELFMLGLLADFLVRRSSGD